MEMSTDEALLPLTM